MNTKNIIGAIVAVLVGLGLGYVIFHHSTPVSQTGAVGDTNQIPKIYQQSISLASTTPFSVNNPANDRLITSVEYYFTGLGTVLSNATGLATFNFTLSTSTDVYTAASSNYVLNTTVATSSGNLYNASSTPGNSGAVTSSRIWGSGTNLNLFLNGTSTATGYLIIHYRQL